MPGFIARGRLTRRDRLSHHHPERPEWRDGQEALLSEHAWGAEPPLFGDRRHFLRDDGVGLHDSAALSPDGFERGLESERGDASAAVRSVDEEARDPPEPCILGGRAHLAVAASRVNPRKLLARTVLTPSDRRLALVHEDRVRTPLADEFRLVPPVDRPMLGCRSASRDRLGSLVVHAPTGALLYGEGLKVRERFAEQFSGREGHSARGARGAK